MTNPIERAADVMPGLDPGNRHLRVATATAALTAALDVDELARVIDRHGEAYDRDCAIYAGCLCGWNNGTAKHNGGYSEHIARAVIAHLTKGNENDE